MVADLKTRLADLEAALGDNVWLDGIEFTVGDLMMISVLGGLRRTNEARRLPAARCLHRAWGEPASTQEGDGRSHGDLRRAGRRLISNARER